MVKWIYVMIVTILITSCLIATVYGNFAVSNNYLYPYNIVVESNATNALGIEEGSVLQLNVTNYDIYDFNILVIFPRYILSLNKSSDSAYQDKCEITFDISTKNMDILVFQLPIIFSNEEKRYDVRKEVVFQFSCVPKLGKTPNGVRVGRLSYPIYILPSMKQFKPTQSANEVQKELVRVAGIIMISVGCLCLYVGFSELQKWRNRCRTVLREKL